MHYFIHIPKTAGTSFRVAAERYFGARRVVYDYGKQSPVTGDSVRAHLYEREAPDMPALLELWRTQNVALIAGHQPFKRFGAEVGLPRTFTFLRNPLERCFSEYLHFQREQRFAGTFRDFFTDMKGNRQLQALSGVPYQALGFVGITERYRESLGLLNELYGWKARYRKTNRAGWRAPSVDSVSAEDRAHFDALNAADIMLYRSACRLLDQRLHLQAGSQPFVYGDFEGEGKGCIRGWAWWAGRDAAEPVELELWENERCIETTVTGELNKKLASSGAPSAGHVGFTFISAVATGNPVNVRVRSTKQWLKTNESVTLWRAQEERHKSNAQR